jgi:hypothetical protein
MPIRSVSPSEAKSLLEASEKVEKFKNRKISETTVSMLLGHIRSGHWKPEVNPGVFILTPSGFVMNGQHTLTAISKHDQPVQVRVEKTKDETLIDYFDTGRGRNAGDLLHINGVTSHALKSAATKVLFAYHAKNPSFLSKSTLSNHEVYEYYLSHRGMDKYLYKAQSLNKEPGVKSSIALAMLYASDPNEDNPEVLEEWFSGLHKNVGLVENDPRTALMRKIRVKKERKSARISREEIIEYIKAWNAWVSDAEMKNLTIGAKEGIPTILPASNKQLKPPTTP